MAEDTMPQYEEDCLEQPDEKTNKINSLEIKRVKNGWIISTNYSNMLIANTLEEALKLASEILE